ncbi:MAG: T9SS type A sorting domain-containing protein, partial [Cytophagales bacterium]
SGDDAEIILVNGINLDLYRQNLNNMGLVNSSSQLKYVFWEKQKAITLTYRDSTRTTTTFVIDLVTGNVTGSISGSSTQTRNFNINVGQFIDNFFNAPGKQIVVQYNRRGATTVNVAVNGLGAIFGACGSRSASWNVQIIDGLTGNPNLFLSGIKLENLNAASYIEFYDCSATNGQQPFTLVTDHLNNATYKWEVFEAITTSRYQILSSTNQNSFQVRFLQQGLFAIRLTVTDFCGRTYSTVAYFEVKDPSSRIVINNQTIAESGDEDGNFSPSCNQIINGFGVSAEPFMGNNSTYEWVLPPGYEITNGGTLVNSTLVNGIIQRTYRGTDFRYTNIRYVGTGGQNVSIPQDGMLTLNINSSCGQRETIRMMIMGISEFGHPISRIFFNGQAVTEPLITRELSLNCTRYEQGLQLSSEPFMGNNSTYEWILPPGYEITNGGSLVSSSTVDGLVQRTYRGIDFRYPYLRYVGSGGQNLTIPDGMLTLNIISACGQRETIRLMIKGIEKPQPIGNLYFSTCQSSFQVNLPVNNGLAPFNVTWFGSGWQSSSTQGLSNTHTTFNSQPSTVYNNYRLRDARNCELFGQIMINYINGNSSADPDVSGWQSGHLNPQQSIYISSNIAKVPAVDQMFFLSGGRLVGYWFDHASTQKWESYRPEFINSRHNNNFIQYFEHINHGKFIFYIEDFTNLLCFRFFIVENNQIRVSPRKYINGFNKTFSSGQTYPFKIFRTGNPNGLAILTKTPQGLFGGVIDISSSDFFYHNEELVISSSSGGGFAGGGVINAVTNDNQLVIDNFETAKVFYFKSNGALSYKLNYLQTGGFSPEVVLNGKLPNDLVLGVSDLVLDKDNNVFFVATKTDGKGDIYFSKASENYNAIYRINTTQPIFNNATTPLSNGRLAINPSSGVLYYTDGSNVYQVYRKPSFNLDNSIGIVKATARSKNDQCKEGLVYDIGHLYYVSHGNQVHNLYYLSNEQECRPKYERKEIKEELSDMDKLASGEELDTWIENINLSENRLHITPNPAYHKVKLDWLGTENGTLEVLDMQGRRLAIHHNFDKTHELEVSDWKPGVYLLRWRGESGQIFSERLVR